MAEMKGGAPTPPVGSFPFAQVACWIVTGSTERDAFTAAILAALEAPAPSGEAEMGEPGRRAAAAHARAVALLREAAVLGELAMYGRRDGNDAAELLPPLMFSGTEAPTIIGNELHGRYGVVCYDLHLILGKQDGERLASMREAVAAGLPRVGAFGLQQRHGRATTRGAEAAQKAAAEALIRQLEARLGRFPTKQEAEGAAKAAKAAARLGQERPGSAPSRQALRGVWEHLARQQQVLPAS